MSGSKTNIALLLAGMTLAGIAIGSLGLFLVVGNQNEQSAPIAASKVASANSVTSNYRRDTDSETENRSAQKKNSNQSGEITQEESNESLNEEDMAALAFRLIDEVAAHPSDPQNSMDVVGRSDEELAEVPPEEIAELIEFALPYAEAKTGEPRYLFALGRAALVYGDEELALELLEKASQRGSSAADAYIAHLTEDLDEMAEHLRRAVEGGFGPAKDWLAEVEAAIAEEQVQMSSAPPSSQFPQFNPDNFNRPDLINAFYTGNTTPLQTELLNNITYASTIHNFLSDTTSVLFITDNRMIVTEIDPNLSHEIEKKLLTTQRGLNQSVDAGLKSILAPFIAIANTRKSGGSIQDELLASNTAIVNSPLVKLDVLKKQAYQDAQRLAILYDSDPDAFRRVYRGLKKFVVEN
ncbi:hypothetical protein [endosymbiont of Lamellibrachia barhami]|uniref:hypothetical protein n=1 Tax=endosymbiont of Lamellibrachia barhami TaxID=205975 RepID=UPI0015ADE6A3|nr:hypothetical protein [endosymbiont of Lamellibrachia barhami]